MTARLKSTPAMGSSLVKRQLVDLLDAMRVRADNDPGCGQAPKLNRAAQEIFAGRFEQAGKLIREAEEVLLERSAQQDHERATALADAQAKLRGVETVRIGKGPSTRDGFLWLIQKGRVSASRRDAGLRYGELYSRARSDGIRSCMNDDIRGGDSEGPAEAKLRATFALEAANRHILASMGQAGKRLVRLLEAVCGRGETLRELAKGDDREARALEADLLTALDMHALHLAGKRN